MSFQEQTPLEDLQCEKCGAPLPFARGMVMTTRSVASSGSGEILRELHVICRCGKRRLLGREIHK